MPEPDFDVVLYGPGGFTGRQTVRYFLQYAPAKLRWAIAGRTITRRSTTWLRGLGWC
jgi:short subunit dehydrogenase-like uncharacterized protein